MRLLGVSAESLQTIISLGFVFFVALGIGANDIPHIFGALISSRTLSIPRSLFFASIFESIGVFLLGNHVLDSRTEMLRFSNNTDFGSIEIMYTEASVLFGSAFWMILASTAKMSVSSTHSMIGASIGASLVINGTISISLRDTIWLVISPFLTAILSVLLHLAIDLVWKMSNGQKSSQIIALVLFGISTSLFLFGMVDCLPTVVRFNLSWYIYFLMSVIITAAVLLGFYMYSNRKESRNPRLSKDEEDAVELVAIQPLSRRRESTGSDAEWRRSVRAASLIIPHPPPSNVLQTRHIFSVLQIVTACFESLIHGSFAYSNVLLPASTTLSILSSTWSPSQMNMFWLGILILVVFGIVAGIVAISFPVLNTVTEKLPTATKPLPMEGANLIVMAISFKMGMPLSTTLSKIFSIFAVGAFLSSSGCGPLKRIVLAWILTIPATGLITASLLKTLLILQKNG